MKRLITLLTLALGLLVGAASIASMSGCEVDVHDHGGPGWHNQHWDHGSWHDNHWH